MVLRASEAVQSQGLTQTQVHQPGAGLVRPDYEAERHTKIDDGRNRILQGLLGQAGDLMKQGFQRSLEDAYLEGVSKVGQIESEAELEGNLFTKDWKVAGYRDTVGRAKMAAASAKLQQDMKHLREQTPEVFQEYLKGMREELLPSLQGMSRQQRNTAFAQLATGTQAAIANHTAEHAKFQIEQKQRSWEASTAAVMASTTQAMQNGPKAYEAATQAAFAHVEGIWRTPEFDTGLRQSLTKEAMQYALSTGNVGLFERLSTQGVTSGEDTLLSRLPIGDQEKLSKEYLAAKDKQRLKLNEGWYKQKGVIEASMATGTYNYSNEEQQAFLDDGIRRGTISPEEFSSMWEKHLKYGMQTKNEAALAGYAESGNVQAIFNAGKSPQDALNAVEKLSQKAEMPLPQYVQKLFSIGQNGMGEAFERAGKTLAPAFIQMDSADGKVNQVNADLMKMAVEHVEAATRAGKENTAVLFMRGLPEEGRMRFQRMRDVLRSEGLDAAGAVARVQKLEATEAKMTPQQKALMAENSAREDRKFLDAIEPRGYMATAWLDIKSVFSESASLELKARPFYDFGDNEAVLDHNANQFKLAVQEELSVVSRITPHASVDQRHSVAMANAAARTLATPVGNLIVPQGTSVHKLLGLPPGYDTKLVGDAIGATFKPQSPSNRYTLEFSQGALHYKEVDHNGITVKNATVSPKDVKAEADAILNRRIQQHDKLEGRGKSSSTPNGTVQYNGLNGAGQQPELMMQFRDTLVKHEGVRDTVYGAYSTSGKRIAVAGVGITGDYLKKHIGDVPAGTKVPQAAIDASFRAASNDAAVAGSTVQRSLGLNDHGFLLMSEMAYQAGTSFYKVSSYSPFLKAVRDKDAEAAKAALKSTPIWKDSGSTRHAHYLELIDKTIGG